VTAGERGSSPVRKRVDWRVRGGVAAAFLVVGIAFLAKDWWDGRASLRGAVSTQDNGVAQESVDAHALRLERTHGIHIDYGNPAKYPTVPQIDIKPAEPRDVAISLQGVEAALQQYPPGFVAKLIKAVLIVGELRMQGERASGTVGAEWVIISARPDYGPEGLREVGFVALHHELSSFVLRADPLTWSKWLQFAPAGWQYSEEPGDALRRGVTADPSPDTGFLNAYGATNLENDFNMYAEEMFVHPDQAARLAQAHPLIRRKLDFVMETYAAIDPQFQRLFREMGLTGN
jgi:hypothetical protein